MDFEQLRQLDAIDREGTMSAAAEALHISQPALSRSMQRLEAEFCQEFFERQGRRCLLNAAGRIALEHARQLLRDERLMRDALSLHAQRARALRVGSVAPAPLWRLTSLAIERLPHAVLTSEMMDDRDVQRRLFDGSLDMGISLRPCVLPTVRCAKLMTESLSVSLPPSHPLAHARSLDAADLDGETFLLYRGIGFWKEFCDRNFPHSEFIVQEDRSVFDRMLRTTPLAYFVTEAAMDGLSAPERSIVPLRDAAAHATYYLLVRENARGEAAVAFDYAREACSEA